MDIGDVHHHLIHAHEPQHARAAPAHEDSADIVKARKAVHVARRKRGDAAVPRKRIVVVIAYILPRAHVVYIAYPAYEAHSGTAVFGMRVSVRAHAVQPRAGAHRVHMAFGIAHHAYGIARVTHIAADAVRFEKRVRLVEQNELRLVARAVVQREMRIQPFDRYCRIQGKTEHFVICAFVKAYAVQARVELYVRTRPRVRAFRAFYYVPGVFRREAGQDYSLFYQPFGFARAAEPEHQHLRIRQERLYFLRLARARHRKKARAQAVQFAAHARSSQSVCVCLQHADKPRGRPEQGQRGFIV